MPEFERRTIDEVLTRYELEPSLMDIYVEGPQDQDLIEGLLEENHIPDVSVFDISTIDIPIRQCGENNNRVRLIEFSKVLAGSFQKQSRKIACVIDSDFDHLKQKYESNIFLLRTDYANMEMYFFNSKTFATINRKCLRSKQILLDTINDFLIPTLKSLFLIRYVNSMPEWRLESLDFDKLVCHQNGCFTFNKHEYIHRYLNKNARLSDFQDFLKHLEGVDIPSNLDDRCLMHGHDFLTLLRKIMNKLLNKRMYVDNEVVFTTLKLCSDYEDLIKAPMFSELLRRFGWGGNLG